MKNKKEKKMSSGGKIPILIFSVFIIAACGFFYELIISTLSSYFLGSSIMHFSITIGVFMFFMGIGSYFSKFIEKDLINKFLIIELMLGLVGGFSALILYAVFSWTAYYYGVAFILISIIGFLVGLEIPIVMRMTEKFSGLKNALADILAFDYIGALVASLLFPLVLLPYIGIVKTAFLTGMLNVLVALLVVYAFKNEIKNKIKIYFIVFISLISLFGGLIYSNTMTSFFESSLYQDEIILSKQTPYQRLIVTKFKNDTRLFINGNLQFSSVDEYRYHEPLVHIPAAIVGNLNSVLVLGGGDGMVVRELLKYKNIKNIDLVDIDGVMTEIAKKNKVFIDLNKNSLNNSKVKIFNQDAFKFVEKSDKTYSLIISDLPDPNDLSVGRMYTQEFYKLLKKRLSGDGILVVQSSSPYFAHKPFWVINNTLSSVFNDVRAYKSYVPSFGLWGYNIASNRKINVDDIKINLDMKYLDRRNIKESFSFSKDISKIETEINHLSNQILINLYDESWEEINLK